MLLRATEYVTSPPASPKQQPSGRVIHAKARPPCCSERVPSPSAPPLVTPDPCLRGDGVSRHREHLAPGQPPSSLLSLSSSPLTGLIGGSVMRFNILIQGATGSGPGLESGQAAALTQFEGYFSSLIRPWEASGLYRTCCCRMVPVSMSFSFLLVQLVQLAWRQIVLHITTVTPQFAVSTTETVLTQFSHKERNNLMFYICRIYKRGQAVQNLSWTAFYKVY